MKTLAKMQTIKEAIQDAKLRMARANVAEGRMYAKGMTYKQRLSFMLANNVTLVAEKVW